MEKGEDIVNNENEEEEEREDLYLKKRKKKFKLTTEEMKAKYDKYLNCKLKYPKSQFFFFILKEHVY